MSAYVATCPHGNDVAFHSLADPERAEIHNSVTEWTYAGLTVRYDTDPATRVGACQMCRAEETTS